MEDIEDLYNDGDFEDDYPLNLEHPTEKEQHSSQKGTKRYRGEVKGLKSPNVPKFLEWDIFNRPTGHWLKDYRQQIGKTVHTKVSILINRWEEVPQGLLDTLWDYIKTMYNIDENPLKKKYVMSHLSDRFRDWKAKLVSGHISKTRKISPNAKPPYPVYEAITEDIWKQFVKAKATDQFKEKSEKARKSQSHNLHPHFMGQKSYSQKEAEWEVEGRYPSVDGTDSSRRPRHLNWIFGRQKKNEKGEYVFPKDESRVVGEKIGKEVEEVEQGIWTPLRKNDVLARSLGKQDRRGRVVALGGTIGHQAYWGKPNRSTRQSDHSFTRLKDIEEDLEARIKQVRSDTICMMEEKMNAMVEENFINLVKKIGLKLPPGMELGKTQITATSEFYNTSLSKPNPDSFSELKSPMSCRLCLLDDYQQLVVVAFGLVYPFCAEEVVHHERMKLDHLKNDKI